MTDAADAPVVVFDFGGVLFHWDPPALVAARWPALAPDREAARALAERFFGGFGGDWAEFDRGTLGRDAIVASVARRTGLDAAGVAAVVDAVPHALRLHAPTAAIVDDLLDAGRRVLYLSNMPAPYVPVLRTREPLIGRFEDGLFSSEEGLVKPEAAIFDRLAARAGCAPSRLVLVDDAAVNVAGARDARWEAVHYTGADDCRARLRALGLPL